MSPHSPIPFAFQKRVLLNPNIDILTYLSYLSVVHKILHRKQASFIHMYQPFKSRTILNNISKKYFQSIYTAFNSLLLR